MSDKGIERIKEVEESRDFWERECKAEMQKRAAFIERLEGEGAVEADHRAKAAIGGSPCRCKWCRKVPS